MIFVAWRRGLFLAIGAFALSEQGHAGQTVWAGGPGDWNNAGQWSVGKPAPGLDVLIDGKPGVTSMVSMKNVSGQSGGVSTISIDKGDRLTMSGSTLAYSGAALRNDGVVDLVGNSLLLANGSLSIAGSGVMTLSGGNAAITAKGGLFNGATHTITGAGNVGSSGNLTNAGYIVSNLANQTLRFGTGFTGTTTNTGHLVARNGGTLMLRDAIVNKGSIDVLDGSTVAIGGNGSLSGGLIRATGSGKMVLSGDYYRLDNVTIAPKTPLVSDNGKLTITGTITNDGEIRLSGSKSYIFVGKVGSKADRIATFNGSGAIVIEPFGSAHGITGYHITNGPKHTIQGAGLIDSQVVINAGVIAADEENQSLHINPSDGVNVDQPTGFFVNSGTLRASFGGTLELHYGVYDNKAGVIEAQPDSYVHFANTTVSGGKIGGEGLGKVELTNAKFEGVAFTAGSRYFSGAGDTTLKGPTTNDGAIFVTGTKNGPARLLMSGVPILTGSGSVQLDDRLGAATLSGTLMLKGGQTIRGSGAIGTGDNASVYNYGGLISADMAGRTLSIDVTGGDSTMGKFDNVGGTIRAIGGGTLSFRTGGYSNTAGTFNALADGRLIFEKGAGLGNLANSTLTGGRYNVLTAGKPANMRLRGGSGKITAIASDTVVTLSGKGTTLEACTVYGNACTNIEATLAEVMQGGRLVVSARDYVVATPDKTFRNEGEMTLSGVLFDTGGLTNVGTLFGDGTITGDIANRGTIRAVKGVLATRRILPAKLDDEEYMGEVRIDEGGTLDLSASNGVSQVRFLRVAGLGIKLGTDKAPVTIVVSSTFTNAYFGSGNAFNPRAGLVGTGAIWAKDGAIKVTGLSPSGTANGFVANFGQVQVGKSAMAKVTLTNSGSTWLQGAVQTKNALAIDVENGDFSLSPGGSTTVTLVFAPKGEGGLNGQVVRVVTNFQNVPVQNIVVQGESFE